MSLNLDLLNIVCRVPLFVRSFGQNCLSDPIVNRLDRRCIGHLLEKLLFGVDLDTFRQYLKDSGMVLTFNHVIVLCNRCVLPHLSIYQCHYHHIRPYGDFSPHHILKERDVPPYVLDLAQYVYSGECLSVDDNSGGFPLTLCNSCDKIYCSHDSLYCFVCGLWSKTILTTGFGVCSCKLLKVKSFFDSNLFRRVPVPDCTVVVDGFTCHEVFRLFCFTNNSSGDDIVKHVSQSKLLGITHENALLNTIQFLPPSRLHFNAYASLVNNLLLLPPNKEKKVNWRKQRNGVNNFKSRPVATPCSISHEGDKQAHP